MLCNTLVAVIWLIIEIYPLQVIKKSFHLRTVLFHLNVHQLQDIILKFIFMDLLPILKKRDNRTG